MLGLGNVVEDKRVTNPFVRSGRLQFAGCSRHDGLALLVIRLQKTTDAKKITS